MLELDDVNWREEGLLCYRKRGVGMACGFSAERVVKMVCKPSRFKHPWISKASRRASVLGCMCSMCAGSSRLVACEPRSALHSLALATDGISHDLA